MKANFIEIKGFSRYLLNISTGTVWSKTRLIESKPRAHNGRIVTTLTGDDNRRHTVQLIPLLMKVYFPNAKRGAGFDFIDGNYLNLSKSNIVLSESGTSINSDRQTKKRITMKVTSIESAINGNVELYNSKDRSQVIRTFKTKLDKTYFPGGASAVRRCMEMNRFVQTLDDAMSIFDYDFNEWNIISLEEPQVQQDDNYEDIPEDIHEAAASQCSAQQQDGLELVEI